MCSSDSQTCRYFSICQEYLSHLQWPKNLFNKSFDRCYCSGCYSINKPNFLRIDTSTYVIPRGWVRFGLHVDEVQASVENIWKTWHNTYHGTDVRSALSILTHGQFLLRDDVRSNGQKLAGRTQYLFTSPTIIYSARYAYAKPEKFISSIGEYFEAKIVFQCKQKPGTYRIQGATGNARLEKHICDIIPKDEIEFYTDIRASVIPYGIMVYLKPITR